MPDQIFTAGSEADYAAFADLVAEYIQWSRARYASDPWFVEQVFGRQSLEAELKTLASSYGPPIGVTLLASREGVTSGAGAYRHFSDGRCEMQRLFVPQRFAGQGTVRWLCQELMRTAARHGYQRMVLDTGNLLKEAISLYHSMGFRECAPYRKYPVELMPFLDCMEAELPAPQSAKPPSRSLVPGGWGWRVEIGGSRRRQGGLLATSKLSRLDRACHAIGQSSGHMRAQPGSHLLRRHGIPHRRRDIAGKNQWRIAALWRHDFIQVRIQQLPGELRMLLGQHQQQCQTHGARLRRNLGGHRDGRGSVR